MPRFNVIRRSDRARIQTDAINPREHLHITGVEFTSEMIKSMSAQPQNHNMFKKEEKPEPQKEVKEEVVIEEVIADVKKEEKKGKSKK